jgi:hypothetical protein
MLRTKLIVGGAMLCLWMGACSSSNRSEFDCATGQLACNCGPQQQCVHGLVCNNHNLCVADDGVGGTNAAGTTGDGATGGDLGSGATGATGGGAGRGAAGNGATGGGAGRGGSNAGDAGTAGSEAGMGGAGMSGDAGQPGAGGSSGGMSGAGGTAGIGGTGGAGAGGTAGISGSGGAGAGGTAGGAGLGGAGGKAGGGAGGKGGGGKGGSGGKCTEITTTTTMVLRDVTGAPDHTRYEYRTNAIGSGQPDDLVLDFRATDGLTGEQTGNFTLGTGADANTETCSRCILVDQDMGAGNEALFLASSGSLAIDSTSHQMIGYPVGTLTNVTFVEVSVDDQGVSTPVTNGRCLHLASLDVAFPSAWTCPADWYANGDACDCGCGARDGDCTSANVSACDFCYCPNDATDCSTNSVRNGNNALCQ